MRVYQLFGLKPKKLTEAKSLLRFGWIANCLLVVLMALSTIQANAQDCGSEGLVCNTNLQISLDSDCSLGLDIDRFIENPLEGVSYQIAFFNEHSRPIDSITSEHINQLIEFQVSCSGNTCWGTIALEANSLPKFDAPCQIKEGQPISFNCQTWCGADIPSVFLTMEDIQSAITDMCVPLVTLGDISEKIIREGDICDPNGQVVTIVHEAKVSTHGRIEVVEILRQSVRQNKISIDSTAANLATILFPPTQFLNCEDGFSPEAIADSTGAVENAYPVYLDEHNLVPDSMFRCDTFVLENIIGLRDTVLPTDTINGNVIWELLTVIDKEFEDSISCARQPILNPDSTVVLIPNKIPLDSRTCNLLAGFSDVSFDACANGQKIVRNWSIIDWCDSSLEIKGSQIIEVSDQEAPVILEEITEFDVYLEPWSCQAIATLPSILAEDNCGEVNVSWYTEEGAIDGNQISDIWYDNSPVELTLAVFDDCQNMESRTIYINVIDDTPPVAICNTSVQVALTASSVEFDNGTAKLFAKDFDEGSSDPQCGKVEFFVVRREDWQNPIVNCSGEFIGYAPTSCYAQTELVDLGDTKSKQCEFNGENLGTVVTKPAEFVKFCCEDVGKLIDVFFIVQDEAGNTNECLVQVLVSNENGPQLVCEDAVITCEDDLHLVPLPTVIDGSICPASYLPFQLADEIVDRANCDSIKVTRQWFIDTDNDGVFSGGDPHCAQNIYITGARDFDDVQLVCSDIELPCTTTLDDLPKPSIEGNNFCICDEDLIRISESRLSNNLCTQDTLYVDWFFDANGDGLFDPFESTCMQAIALTTDASMFTILCEPVTISCNESIAEVTRPTVEGTPDACLCPEEFLKVDSVEEFRNDCEQESVQRSWYIDVNQNNQRDENEDSCIQEIFINYTDVDFSLSCNDVELQCGQDLNSAVELPQIIQNGGCSCDAQPALILIGEQTDLNVCGVDRITRSYYLDLNGNQMVDVDEPQCDQAITINNMQQPITISCDNATIDCFDQLDGLFIPTIENQNTCGCTSPQLELRNTINLDGVCLGDIITREWFVDLDGNRQFDQGEPACIQELTVQVEGDNPSADQSMVFNCGPAISVSCTDNLNAIAAPSLMVSDGFCDCSDVDIILSATSESTEGICVGDTIVRMFFADSNSNGTLDNAEPTCEQVLVIVGSQLTDIVCQDQTINCTTSLAQIQAPTVQTTGFCACDDLQPQLIASDDTDNLCFGDQFTRTYFIDVDGDDFADEDEPTCIQTISINTQNIMVDFEDCDTLTLSCDQNINNFPPTVNAQQGICACNRDFDLTLSGGNLEENICPGETMIREWFIDLDNDGIQSNDEPACAQVIIAADFEVMSLVCESSTVSCLERNAPLNPPVIENMEMCDCDDIDIILSVEFGADDRCPGDTLFREWFADLNANSLIDSDEPTCLQEIILVDDNPVVSFDCSPIRVSCFSEIDSLLPPQINVDNSCGCSTFEAELLSDGLLDSLCAGDTTSRMWYIDIDGNDFADEDEPFCLQEIVVTSRQPATVENFELDTVVINCQTDIDSLVPNAMLTLGFCDCNAITNLVLLDTMDIEFCVNDTFSREWIIDLNNNGVRDPLERTITEVLRVEASDSSFAVNCEDQFSDCLVEEVPALVPSITAEDGCVCPDIQPLILRQFGAEDRCVGDTLFREWYADINANSNFDNGEPTCVQNVILMDESSTLTLDCPQVSITCDTQADSIPLPTILSESACGCMNNVLTLLRDGSIGGICFGESFTREYYLDMNSDGVPQDDEAFCRQIISVDGAVDDMTFNCEPQMIQCTDTLSQIAPPEINAIGICTCNQFNLSIAEVSIPASICEGDTIIQRWFADTNPNNQFDTLDIFCDQILILEEPEEFIFNCDTVSVTCDQDLSLLVPPTFTAPGLCNCSDLSVLLADISDVPDMTCIGDEIIRTWYIDENEDGSFQDEETTCEQVLMYIGDEQSFSISCDTFFVDCTDSIAMIDLPTLMPLSDCVCDSIDLIMLDDEDLNLCPLDTTFRLFFGDVNNDGLLSEGEPNCSQVIIVNDTADKFDPLTIKWPASFIGESDNGVLLTCSNDTVFANREMIIGNDPMSCMPADFTPRPFWCESDCDLVTFSVQSDTIMNIASCPSITNTFTIIDWCTFDSEVTDSTEVDSDSFELVMDLAQEDCGLCPTIPDTLYTRYAQVDVDGFYQYTQEINIVDNEPPVVSIMQDTIIVNVTPNDTTNICTGSIDVTANAVDMCEGAESDPESIQWTIRVVDENRAPVISESGDAIEIRAGAMASINSREGMPGDTFSIVWTVRDACNSASITETKVIFVDSLAQCDTTTMDNGLIGGVVHTELGESLQGASITLNGNEMETAKIETTSLAGRYMFHNNNMASDYAVSVAKEDAHAKGISTADVITIHNHITKEDLLDSPYKLIAADVTNDTKVNIDDIVELKQLILGTKQTFVNNDAWRFISDHSQFFDTTNPWPFVETMEIRDFNASMMDANFTAVKIGDVTDDVMNTTEARQHQEITLFIIDKAVIKEEPFSADVIMSSTKEIVGLQGTISTLDLVDLNISSEKIDIDKSDYNYTSNTFSYSFHKIQNKKTDLLFTLTGMPVKEGFLSDFLTFNNLVTRTEVYGVDGVIYNVNIEFVTEKPSFSAGNYTPNPFTEISTIDIELPSQGKLNYSIYSATGRLVKQDEIYLQAGKQQLSIANKDLTGNGLYTVVFEHKGSRLAKRVVLID